MKSFKENVLIRSTKQIHCVIFSICILLSFLSTVVIAATENDLIDAGIQALKSRDYNTATTNLYQALSLSQSTSRGNNQAKYYLIRSYFETGGYNQAQSLITELFQNYPVGTYVDGALYYRMKIALNQGNFTQLTASFVQLTTAYPQCVIMPSAYLCYSEGLLEINHDFPSTIIYTKKIIDEYPNDFLVPTAMVYLATTYYTNTTINKSYRLAQCEYYLNRCLSQYPQSTCAPRAQYIKGHIQEYEYSNLTVAIQEYQKLITQWPNDINSPMAQCEIGNCYKKMNDKPNAITAYQKVIQNYPHKIQVNQARQSILLIQNGTTYSMQSVSKQ